MAAKRRFQLGREVISTHLSHGIHPNATPARCSVPTQSPSLPPRRMESAEPSRPTPGTVDELKLESCRRLPRSPPRAACSRCGPAPGLRPDFASAGWVRIRTVSGFGKTGTRLLLPAGATWPCPDSRAAAGGSPTGHTARGADPHFAIMEGRAPPRPSSARRVTLPSAFTPRPRKLHVQVAVSLEDSRSHVGPGRESIGACSAHQEPRAPSFHACGPLGPHPIGIRQRHRGSRTKFSPALMLTSQVKTIPCAPRCAIVCR